MGPLFCVEYSVIYLLLLDWMERACL